MDREARKITIIVLLLGLPSAYGIIGYDCGSASANLTTLSLLNIEECDISQQNVNSSRTYIQLLQINEFESIKVIQCKVEIDRLIRKCGMFSHSIDVFNGKYAYVQEISREACRRMHTYGSFQLAETFITGLKSNQSATRPVTLAGHVDTDGSCSGGIYSDPYGTWADAVVLGSIKITLQDYTADVRINTNRVQLRSGVACELSATYCSDIEGGDTFWDPVPADTCKFSNYGILYESYADKIIDNINQQAQKESPIIYTVTTKETTFALARTSDTNLCGYRITQTEHPKLFILETQSGRTFKPQSRIAIDNLDIFSYVNSKFIYVEKHLKTQLTQLYRDIMGQKCALERQILDNALSLSSIAPDEMAFRLMKSPGYMAITAGEVIHIIKCVPILCKIRQMEGCYNELPVSHGNTSYFLSPRSRILMRTGTTRDCSELLPTMYRIDDTWFRITPRPVEALPPPIIQPLTKPKWKYVSPSNLATSGIYSTEDLDRLRNHIMFPVEKPAMLNTIAQGAMGHAIPHGSVSLYNLMDEKSLEKIAEKRRNTAVARIHHVRVSKRRSACHNPISETC
ncbi:hypothetical protein ACFW04_011315 [Cataglyphis niger]